MMKCKDLLCFYLLYCSVYLCVSHPPPVSIRTILGTYTDPTIDVSDPISDHFYKEVWMSTSARNASIYQRVSVLLCIQLNFFFLFLKYIFYTSFLLFNG